MQHREITTILSSAGLRPRHRFGQNFMIDQSILTAIADAGDIQPNDIVLEVGPGVGNLTRLLAQRAAAVLAVDIDRKLLPAAKRHHANLTNVHWLNADILAGKHAIEPAVLDQLRSLCTAHPNAQLRLVSNLPYNAASPLIAELLVQMCGANRLFFSRLTFTVQYEVALRMSAQPNSRDYGPLSILIQSLSTPEVIRKIPPGAFWPPPKVHSALVTITPDPTRIQKLPNPQSLQHLLTGIFSHRRQTLANALKHHLTTRWTPELKATLAAHFDLTRRPEAFPIEDFLHLATLLTTADQSPPSATAGPLDDQ